MSDSEGLKRARSKEMNNHPQGKSASSAKKNTLKIPRGGKK